jgi:hypothetical protein
MVRTFETIDTCFSHLSRAPASRVLSENTQVAPSKLQITSFNQANSGKYNIILS